MTQNILFQYFQWHYYDQLKVILKAWRNYLKFNLNYWSVFLLLKTLFSPWRGYRWSYGRGFSIKRYAQAAFSNFASRLIGAMIRLVLIVIGILTEVFVVLVGAVVFLGWIFLPWVLIYGLYFGFKVLI